MDEHTIRLSYCVSVLCVGYHLIYIYTRAKSEGQSTDDLLLVARLLLLGYSIGFVGNRNESISGFTNSSAGECACAQASVSAGERTNTTQTMINGDITRNRISWTTITPPIKNDQNNDSLKSRCFIAATYYSKDGKSHVRRKYTNCNAHPLIVFATTPLQDFDSDHAARFIVCY